MPDRGLTRRSFLRSASVIAASTFVARSRLGASPVPSQEFLSEFAYGDVTVTSPLHAQQLQQTISVLLGLSDDSLLKPFRQMAGQPAPGDDIGGWYRFDPNYDPHTSGAGLAPGATFGQWISAFARTYAANRDPQLQQKILRLNRLYAQTISPAFFDKTRFPAYTYDKLVCGLIDSCRLAVDPNALRILDQTTDAAIPHLPHKAIERGQSWRPGTDESYAWDESYTLPENLFLAYHLGAGNRYRELATRYLDEDYFGPLARNQNILAGRHAYSYVNALSSSAQAFLTLGDEKYLHATRNGFAMLAAQSFATGGWGPDEKLRAPASNDLVDSLSQSHSSFETPCGSYAHFKLARYLLRITRDPGYGDSMERVMYNAVLGAKPLQPDGRAFYYSDYNFQRKKAYSTHCWPCCSGTLPQVAADYGINSWFHDSRGIYANLYISSTVRWLHDGTPVSLTQETSYPFDSLIQFQISPATPKEFSVAFRIPSWADGATLSVNGKRSADPIQPGTFATSRRVWKQGDRVELDLPLTKRLEPLDSHHSTTVALLQGPLVLFPVSNSAPPPTRNQLLAATTTRSRAWQVDTPNGPLKLLPFISIEDEPYSTYLNVR